MTELIGVGDAYRQAITAFTIGLEALERAGCPRSQVIQTRMYITDRANADAVLDAAGEARVLGDAAAGQPDK